MLKSRTQLSYLIYLNTVSHRKLSRNMSKTRLSAKTRKLPINYRDQQSLYTNVSVQKPPTKPCECQQGRIPPTPEENQLLHLRRNSSEKFFISHKYAFLKKIFFLSMCILIFKKLIVLYYRCLFTFFLFLTSNRIFFSFFSLKWKGA